ncbi:cholecystokinin-like [Chanos chanos]|uniref:Cholecystokinin-like n=1 Tax=Chanos chanos TaxID=29144 RepID=A0A6J2WNV3_CHACN|nr:cholecystokinin-like [Chanos chanos]
MKGGFCVCVLLAALSASCLGHPDSSTPQVQDSPLPSRTDDGEEAHSRTARSAPRNAPLQPYASSEGEVESRANLSKLLAKLISRKGSVRRNSMMSGRGKKDGDYVGWMDFGRRSAEEYEYSS